MKRRCSIFLSILLFGCLISCNNNNTAVHSLGKTKTKTSSEGSSKIGDIKKQKLSSMLYELAVSQDPESFAKTHDIEWDKDRIRVFIFFDPLTSDPDRTRIMKDHKIIIEKRSADLIRGLVPVDHLIPLSQDPVIQSIRLPDKLIKAKEMNP